MLGSFLLETNNINHHQQNNTNMFHVIDVGGAGSVKINVRRFGLEAVPNNKFTIQTFLCFMHYQHQYSRDEPTGNFCILPPLFSK